MMVGTLFDAAPESNRMAPGIHPVLTSSESNEWYTPKEYIEAARLVMGSIDVDPASCEYANRVVKAPLYYTKETNGYHKQWYTIDGQPSNVWLNPPYGRGDAHKANQSLWIQRLLEQHQAGIVKQSVALVNAKMGDKWFQPLYNYPICFPDHRVNFTQPNGQPSSGAAHSSALVYLGPYIEKFIDIFSRFGNIGMFVRKYSPTLWTPESEVA